MKLPAISLWQPWASLIEIGAKPYETRSWAPPRRLIGQRIAVHAAKRAVAPILRDLDRETISQMAHAFGWDAYGDPDWHERLPLGEVVCTAVLVAAYEMGADWTGTSMSGEVRRIVPDAFGDYSLGRWAWRLTNIERLQPSIPYRGAQGFWQCELEAA